MGLLNNLIIMHVTRRSSNTMLSPPHGQGATIRQFGPQRATLSTRTTVKWLLLLGLVTVAVAKPNPTIERMKRASVQMHTYRRRPLVSKAEAAARRRRLVHNVSGKKNLKGDMWDFQTTEEFEGLHEERQSQKLRPGWTESKNRNGRSVYKH